MINSIFRLTTLRLHRTQLENILQTLDVYVLLPFKIHELHCKLQAANTSVQN